ncbi:MAG: hypothetical protein KFF77_06640 [Bacteroidetes bacterium]|nr:hypothetical protein [Bacteroidota bacterium]
MRHLRVLCVAAVYVFLCTDLAIAASASASPAPAAATPTAPDSLEQLVRGLLAPASVQVSGEWFIAYENGKEAGTQYSNFFINRGYINVRKQLLPWLSGRITPDISVDRDGDGEGDLELRLKYCYVRADLPDLAFITTPAVEFGLIERPWLGFEQKVNRYRVLGNMFLEREDILNSADFGAVIEGTFGGEMDKEYRSTVNSSWAGRYGSYSIGFFNGGGYHAIERNNNKALEGRISLRPLPGIISGLQITYAGTYAKGNTTLSPDWTMHVGYASYEHKHCVLTATWFQGEGDQRGRAVDENNVAIPQEGYSAFGELRLGDLPFNLFGRYDHFTVDPDAVVSLVTTRVIAGAAYRLDRQSMLVVDYELDRDDNDVTLLSTVKFSVLYKF